MYRTQSTADACDLKMSWLSSGILNTLQVWSCPTVTALSCKRVAESGHFESDAQTSRSIVGATMQSGLQRACSSSAEGAHAGPINLGPINLMPGDSAGWTQAAMQSHRLLHHWGCRRLQQAANDWCSLRMHEDTRATARPC